MADDQAAVQRQYRKRVAEERERMRAALERIAGNGDGAGRNPQLMVDIALEALK